MCRNVTDVVFKTVRDKYLNRFFNLTTIKATQKKLRRFDDGWISLSRQCTSLIYKQIILLAQLRFEFPDFQSG